MSITQMDLDAWFSYIPPNYDQVERHHIINEAAKRFSRIIIKMTGSGNDQREAVRKIREAVFFASQAIDASEWKDNIGDLLELEGIKYNK